MPQFLSNDSHLDRQHRRRTASYRGYSGEHVVDVDGKPPLKASADPAFRGDPELHNPEDLLVAALSQCHMLWYLALCSTSGIVVTAYQDDASGDMVETPTPVGTSPRSCSAHR